MFPTLCLVCGHTRPTDGAQPCKVCGMARTAGDVTWTHIPWTAAEAVRRWVGAALLALVAVGCVTVVVALYTTARHGSPGARVVLGVAMLCALNLLWGTLALIVRGVMARKWSWRSADGHCTGMVEASLQRIRHARGASYIFKPMDAGAIPPWLSSEAVMAARPKRIRAAARLERVSRGVASWSGARLVITAALLGLAARRRMAFAFTTRTTWRLSAGHAVPAAHRQQSMELSTLAATHPTDEPWLEAQILARLTAHAGQAVPSPTEGAP